MDIVAQAVQASSQIVLGINLRINATTLAQLNHPEVCERCFAFEWLLGQQLAIQRLRIPFRLPMPGIFSSIDSHVKRLVRENLDKTGALPPWFPELGLNVLGYISSSQLHWSRFRATSKTTGIMVTASPDEIFVLNEGHLLLDYKTASYTDTARELFPKYQAQLAIEAVIGRRIGILQPKAGALLYMQPAGGEPIMGPALGFKSELKWVQLDLGIPQRLLVRAKLIADTVNGGGLPASAPGCPHCRITARFVHIFGQLVGGRQGAS